MMSRLCAAISTVVSFMMIMAASAFAQGCPAKELYSGVIAGLNNKLKVTMRKSYGFRSFRITVIALCHVLGKLTEPRFTHSFY